MIDGIKAYIKNVDVREFLNDPLFLFTGNYNASTGEVLKSPLTAKYNGLTVRLVPSTVNDETMCLIDGSIHRFYNSGGTNNDDFNYCQLRESLDGVQIVFKKCLNEIILQNLEFGVNLNTELTATKIIRSIISNAGRRFAEMCIKDVAIGKVCTKQGADYELKIYDKGKQSETGERRLLRIEVKVKKMRFLEPYGIGSLADLLNPEKIGLLGQVLANMWGNLIFYDGSIKETQLTHTDQLKLKDYQNPLFWEDLNKHKAYKARRHFAGLMSKYSTRTLQKDIQEMILTKWSKLVNSTPKMDTKTNKIEAENGRPFHQLFNDDEAEKKATISQLEYMCEKVANQPHKKATKNKTFCLSCGREITNQKTGSKFCSEKHFGKSARVCRNKASNQARTHRNRMNRNRESQLLKELTPNVQKRLRMKIEVKTNTGLEVQEVTRIAIKAINYNQFKKIVGIAGSCGGVPFSFSRSVAKKFIIIINNQTITNNETKKRRCKRKKKRVSKTV